MTLSLAGGNSGGDPHQGSGSAGNTSCSIPWGIIVDLAAQNKRSDCSEMLGKMVTTVDQHVCVSGERDVSELHQLGLDIS
jgi:hypothetical protein